jgi:hypothetical protein
MENNFRELGVDELFGSYRRDVQCSAPQDLSSGFGVLGISALCACIFICIIILYATRNTVLPSLARPKADR